nr:MAG TPA: hypothetical protein [Caudoviricetes sp.]
MAGRRCLPSRGYRGSVPGPAPCGRVVVVAAPSLCGRLDVGGCSDRLPVRTRPAMVRGREEVAAQCS